MTTRTAKVGRIDDPIWGEPSPVPTQHGRGRGVVRTAAAVGVILAIGAGLAWFYWPSGPPSWGDPGGRILKHLRPISMAVPPTADVAYAQYVEPHLDSCDGRAGTFGWDAVSADVQFSWSGTPQALLDHVDAVLVQSGWGSYKPESQNGVPGDAWTKRLDNGTMARVQLGFDAYGSWHLFAMAPPMGRQVSGC